jgi:hypothetical protein
MLCCTDSELSTAECWSGPRYMPGPSSMRFPIIIALLLLLSIATASSVYAEVTLQLLAKECEGLEPDHTRPVIGQMSCVSYIAGALDQIILADGLAVRSGKQAKPTICAPENVTKVEQLTAIIKKIAKEQPEMLHESARSVLLGLVTRLYKCE